MKKNKILFIHHSGLFGGAGISLYFTAKELSKFYDIKCYIPDDPPELKDFLKDKKIPYETFDYRLGKITFYSGGNSILHPKFFYHCFRALIHFPKWKKIINKEKPDLLIVNSIVLSWIGLIKGDHKSLCFVRETKKKDHFNFFNIFLKRLLEKFTMVSFLSKYDKKDWNLNSAKSLVIHDFMETENYIPKNNKTFACRKLKIHDNQFNILFLGGFNKLKGTEIAIKAISNLKNNNIKLILAGNNPGKFQLSSLKEVANSLIYFKNKKYFRKMRKLISENNLNNHIRYIGIQNNIGDIFDACDLLIIPIQEAHQARPIFEFGCQKKPVIVSNFVNLKEFVKDGHNGLTFKHDDYDELSHKIKLLYNDNDLYLKLGMNNFLNSKNHEVDVNIKRLVEYIGDFF